MTLLLIYFVYIVIWVALVYLSYRIALKLSQSKKIAVAASLVAFLVMYWPAFGDLIPTLYTHKQLCEKEAGFKIFVTPEQWAAENPGVLETLVPYEKFIFEDHMVVTNERFGVKHDKTKITEAVHKSESVIVDLKTQKTIAKKTDFIRGYGNYFVNGKIQAIKMWLHSMSCYPDSESEELRATKKQYFRQLKMEK